MGMKMVTPMSKLDAILKEEQKRIERSVIRTMQYCGEAVLNEARKSGTYKDQTGNLRSSLGYVLAIDGRIVTESTFNQVKQGAEGAATGAALARSLVNRHPKGIVLIVVAGMKYASYVADRGYDVLDSAEFKAGRIVPKMLKSMGIDSDGFDINNINFDGISIK